MNWRIKCILFFVIICNNLHAQSDSTIWFEKQIYQAGSIDELKQWIIRKYYYVKQQGNFALALSTLQRINEPMQLESEKDFFMIERGVCSYLCGKLADAEFEFNRVYQELDSSHHKQVLGFLVLSLIEQRKYKQALPIALNWARINNIDSTAIKQLFKLPLKRKFKTEVKAEGLSTFLPGTGQIYVGEFTHGTINAFIILSGLAWGGYNVLNGYYATGIFTGFLFSYSFYSGGINYAISKVDKRNKVIQEKLNVPIRNLVIQAETQKKPIE